MLHTVPLYIDRFFISAYWTHICLLKNCSYIIVCKETDPLKCKGFLFFYKFAFSLSMVSQKPTKVETL